jgi:hypothetical protein
MADNSDDGSVLVPVLNVKVASFQLSRHLALMPSQKKRRVGHTVLFIGSLMG